MTDTTNVPSGDLSSLKVAQLQQIAAQLGIKGARRMRKSDLIDALRAGGEPGGQGGQPSARGGKQAAPAGSSGRGQQAKTETADDDQSPAPSDGAPASDPGGAARQVGPSGSPGGGGAEADPSGEPADRRGDRGRKGPGQQRPDGEQRQGGQQRNGADAQAGRGKQPPKGGGPQGDQRTRDQRQQDKSGAGERRRPSVDDIQLPDPRPVESEGPRRATRGQGPADRQDGEGREDSDRSNRRRRGRDRNRDRKRRGGRSHDDLPYDDIELSPDDVLIPIAGILDILDNYAFVRTSGYLPGANDVYVSLNQVRRYGLRRGDAVVGAVRQPREGEQTSQRQKFNALVRLDTVNGAPAEESSERPEFATLTPLHPQERLPLQTKASDYTTRIVDLFTPLGKGQRGLIVAPPKTGKTIILQRLAEAITSNSPDVHLMVVLVDERPEDVTEMQRTVKGEVISSTFDRPAADHTTVAELAIERAKRLVELGQDVVVLLDSLTGLARAYNLAAPASGRVLAGGVDASALYLPKRFFGAARNIEHGGSLTILATALVQTYSAMDEVIFAEFTHTPNWELHLSADLAEKRIFPAVNLNASSTRREEILLSESEVQAKWKLRRSIADLEPQQALEKVLSSMRGTRTNAEVLAGVNKSAR